MELRRLIREEINKILMEEEDIYCERCGEKLNRKKIVTLELATDGKYYKPEEFPEGKESQGGFSFGTACAKKVLANDGINEKIRKGKD